MPGLPGLAEERRQGMHVPRERVPFVVQHLASARLGIRRRIVEKSLRAMRTDGMPTACGKLRKRHSKSTPCSTASCRTPSDADLRPFFDRMGYEYDIEYYRTIDAKVGRVVSNLPDEDDLDGLKEESAERTLLPPHHARRKLARCRGGGASLGRALGDRPQPAGVAMAAKPFRDISPGVDWLPECWAATELELGFRAIGPGSPIGILASRQAARSVFCPSRDGLRKVAGGELTGPKLSGDHRSRQEAALLTSASAIPIITPGRARRRGSSRDSGVQVRFRDQFLDDIRRLG